MNQARSRTMVERWAEKSRRQLLGAIAAQNGRRPDVALTVSQAAQLLGFNERPDFVASVAVRRLVAIGELPDQPRAGTHRKYLLSDLLALVERARREPR